MPRDPKPLSGSMRRLVEDRIGQGLANRVIKERTGVSLATISEIRRQLKSQGGAKPESTIDGNRYYPF